MPSKSQAQQRFFGAELARKRAGKKTQTGMKASQLEDFASTKHEGLPKKVGKGQDEERYPGYTHQEPMTKRDTTPVRDDWRKDGKDEKAGRGQGYKKVGYGQAAPPPPMDLGMGMPPAPPPMAPPSGMPSTPPVAGGGDDLLAKRAQLKQELAQVEAEIATKSQPTGPSGLPMPTGQPPAPPAGLMGVGPPAGPPMPPGPMPPPTPGMGQSVPRRNAASLAALGDSGDAGLAGGAPPTPSLPSIEAPTPQMPATPKGKVKKVPSKKGGSAKAKSAKKAPTRRQSRIGKGQALDQVPAAQEGVGSWLAQTTLGAPSAAQPEPQYTMLSRVGRERGPTRQKHGYSFYRGSNIADGWYDDQGRLVQSKHEGRRPPRPGTPPTPIGAGQGLAPNMAPRGGLFGQPEPEMQNGGPAGAPMGRRRPAPA